MIETNLDQYIIKIGINELVVKNKDCQDEFKTTINYMQGTYLKHENSKKLKVKEQKKHIK